MSLKDSGIYPIGENVLIVFHKDPDGDCYGSGCIIRELLISEGFNPENIKFLADNIPDRKYLNKWIPDITFIEEQDIDKSTTAIFVDHQNPSLSCLNNLFHENIIQKIYIDHHFHIDELNILRNPDVKTLIDKKRFSTTDLIYETFKDDIKALDKETRARIATYVYAGIYYDAGRFISGMTAEYIRKLNELLDLGADIEGANLIGFLSFFEREREISVALRACNKERGAPIVKIDGYKHEGSGKYVSKSHFSKEYLYGRLLLCKDVWNVFAIYPGQYQNGKVCIHIRTTEPEALKIFLPQESWRTNSHTFVGVEYQDALKMYKNYLNIIKKLNTQRQERKQVSIKK